MYSACIYTSEDVINGEGRYSARLTAQEKLKKILLNSSKEQSLNALLQRNKLIFK
jgi:hypothetical protein